jgi:hypothetical protein
MRDVSPEQKYGVRWNTYELKFKSTETVDVKIAFIFI